MARADIKVALGLLGARHVAGDPALTTQLREGALEDWRAVARTRLAELRDLHDERARSRRAGVPARTRPQGGRGGLRDVLAIRAIAAAWVASAPGPRIRAAYRIDPRRPAHPARGHRPRLRPAGPRRAGRGSPGRGAAGRRRAAARAGGAGRTVAYAVDHAFRQADRAAQAAAAAEAGAPPARRRRCRAGRRGRPGAGRRPGTDPALVLRAAAAAAQAGRRLAPRARRAAGRRARRCPSPGRRGPRRADLAARRRARRRSACGRRSTRRAW